MMNIWSESQARRALLPPTAKGFYLVLFVDSSSTCANQIERFEEFSNGLGLSTAVVEYDDGSSEVARWFRIKQFPTMAVVFDGMLLSVEYECTEGSCERVARDAIEQFRLFARFEAVV